MLLQIRNMESSCCIRVVKDELLKLGLRPKTVKLGKVEIDEEISAEQLRLIDTSLRNAGLEIIKDNKNLLVENVKAIIHQNIYFSDDFSKKNFSEYITRKVKFNYTHLSTLFKRVMGITIEKYIINVKIERVKELLVYEHLSLNEISFKLNYSSVAHLSNQFKKVTGLTSSFYRQLGDTRSINKIKDNFYVSDKKDNVN